MNSLPLHSIPSNNPYIANLISNMNKSVEHAFALDSIAEKDEFGKVFVRANHKNNEKVESTQNNKYIQRHQDSNKSGKQKINVMSDNSMIKSFDARINPNLDVKQTPNLESVSNIANIRYIKSPTNA